jgi:hypothetical protein
MIICGSCIDLSCDWPRGCCIIIDLLPAKLIGDTTYGTAAMLNWLVNEHGIARA